MTLRALYVEPFEAGSHARFTRTLTSGVDADWTVLTLPGRHWKWRMRGTAPYLALEQEDRLREPFDVVWASSFVNLAELRGLVPALARTPAVLFFHENQFAYPARPGPASRFDLDFGFVQMVSALAATRIVFTSEWNRHSFEDGARALLARLPDAVPRGWIETLAARSEVLPVPLDLPDVAAAALGETGDEDRSRGPVILWNHRWEHDKAPETFFAALERLAGRGVPFRVAVCGPRFRDAPAIFDEARARLGTRMVHFGTVADGDAYRTLLETAHVVVSTARQEFFGIALLEAVWHGARPLAPRRLSYPELLPGELLYGDGEDHDDDGRRIDALACALERLCTAWTAGAALRADRRALVERFRSDAVLPRYADLLHRVAATPA